MNRCVAKSTALSLVCFVGFLLFGCGGSSDGPSHGEWTMQKEPLRLTEDLRVSETENFFFGSIQDLDVTSDGRIVVADQQASNVKVLSPDGTLVDTLGQEGQGPGEFRRLTNVQIARGDSLFAYDHQLSRITVFGPDAPYEVSRTVIIRRKGGVPIHTQALDEGFVARFVIPPRPDPGVSRTEPRTWRRIDESGTLGDTVLTTPGLRVLATKKAFGKIPLSSIVHYTWGPKGRLYYGWNDSLHIKAQSAEGSLKVMASVPTEPVPLTDADRDSILSDVAESWRSRMASVLPDTKPAFTDLVVAGNGRLWVQRPAKGPNPERVPWWILDPEKKTIQEVRLPKDVEIQVVKGGFAYGRATTEEGAPAVVRYQIEES